MNLISSAVKKCKVWGNWSRLCNRRKNVYIL